MKDIFRKIATRTSNIAGSAITFLAALLLVLVWAGTGPMFNFSDTWQLVINTGTTIITFLMVFLIQNTQNRDGRAMQLKLDELIRATRARQDFIDIESLSDDELAKLAEQFSRLEQSKSDDAFKKFNMMLQAAVTKRRRLPGERIVSGAVSLLNPFSGSSGKKPKK